MKALIGYNGFVGSNLKKRIKFQKFYNSSNIHKIKKFFFEEVYCAAPHGIKFLANKYPNKDKKIILGFINNLKKIKCKKFILFSTIDVYPNVPGLNEEFNIFKSKTNYYGENRKLLERFVMDNFNDHMILRLPSLFGSGLKKNALYDIIAEKKIMANKKSFFQWYNLNNLAKDVKILKKHKIKTINLVSEPISMNDITKSLKINQADFAGGKVLKYDFYTKFYYHFSKKKNYISSKKIITKEIKKFYINKKITKNELIKYTKKKIFKLLK